MIGITRVIETITRASTSTYVGFANRLQCSYPTPTTDGNKRKRDTAVSGEALSSPSSGVSSSGQASSKGMFNLNSSILQTHAQLVKRRRIEQESATKIQAANESSEVSSGGATSSTLCLVDIRRYASYQDRFGLPPSGANQNSTTTTTTTQVSGTTSAFRITSTPITPLTDQEIEVSVSMYDMIYDIAYVLVYQVSYLLINQLHKTTHTYTAHSAPPY